MIDWYYHDPVAGRVGPLSPEELRQHFRQRRIARETLAWRQGLPEWLPLGRLTAELELDTVAPDTALPPPLPPSLPPRGAASASVPAPVRRQGMHGCLIALLVCVALAVPLAGILAAIAIPAYRDYVERAKQAAASAPAAGPEARRLAAADAQVRALLERAMATSSPQPQPCPDTYEFERLLVRDPGLAGDFRVELLAAGTQRCTYRVTFLRQGPLLEGKALRYDAARTAGGVAVGCSTTDLPAELRPPNCG